MPQAVASLHEKNKKGGSSGGSGDSGAEEWYHEARQY